MEYLDMETIMALNPVLMDENGDALELQEWTRMLTEGYQPYWRNMGFSLANNSFGIAVVNPELTEPGHVIDDNTLEDPENFLYFVCGWGPDGMKYAANAARKLPARLRTKRETLDLRRNSPELLINPVDSVEPDGRYKNGQFPYGGTASFPTSHGELVGAVSTFTELQDAQVTYDMLQELAGTFPELA